MKHLLCASLFVVTALTLSASDLTETKEASIFVGGNHVGSGGGNHGMFSVAGGYGIAPKAQIYGDYSLTTCGPGCKINDIQGGVKVNIRDTDKYDPYVAVGIGVGHFSGGGGTHFGFHLGGGVRIYVPAKKNKWGVTPDFRYGHYFVSNKDLNVFRFGAGVFYEWGK